MRVFCRVKPIIDEYDEEKVISYPQVLYDEGGAQHHTLELFNPRQQSNHMYNFDHVFLPDTKQEDIFEEIKPFVQTAMDGMNVCIFAYGQTGSGKTYTMEGPSIDCMNGSFTDINMKPVSKSGILPRIACLLQSEMAKYHKYGHPLTIQVSALEIYCELIYDLLNPRKESSPLELRAQGNKVNCVGQKWVPIKNARDFLD